MLTVSFLAANPVCWYPSASILNVLSGMMIFYELVPSEGVRWHLMNRVAISHLHSLAVSQLFDDSNLLMVGAQELLLTGGFQTSVPFLVTLLGLPPAILVVWSLPD